MLYCIREGWFLVVQQDSFLVKVNVSSRARSNWASLACWGLSNEFGSTFFCCTRSCAVASPPSCLRALIAACLWFWFLRLRNNRSRDLLVLCLVSAESKRLWMELKLYSQYLSSSRIRRRTDNSYTQKQKLFNIAAGPPRKKKCLKACVSHGRGLFSVSFSGGALPFHVPGSPESRRILCFTVMCWGFTLESNFEQFLPNSKTKRNMFLKYVKKRYNSWKRRSKILGRTSSS